MPEFDPQNEPVGSRSLWLAPLGKAYDRFLKIRGNPREIALGFALGLFVGMTPFMGLHMAIAVPLAALLKWNKFSAALAVWVSNPLSAPLIYSMTYYIGVRVLFLQNGFKLPAAFDLDALITLLKNAPEIIGILLVGGAVAGLPIAIVGYLFAFRAIVKYRASIQRKLEQEKARLALKLKGRRSRKPKTKKKRR